MAGFSSKSSASFSAGEPRAPPPPPRSCYNCRTPNLVNPKPGWPLKNGGFALLCSDCGFVYGEERFCETFHLKQNGWRKCVACRKPVHCGCPASIPTIILLQSCDVACLKCVQNAPSVAEDEYDSLSWSPTRAEFVLDTSGPCEVEQSGINEDANQVHSPTQVQAPLPGAQPCGGENTFLGFKYRPRTSHEDIEQISRDLNSRISPLFEKILTISDADNKLARLVIPKRCAEAFLPQISDPEGITISFLDTSGMEWQSHYRYWPNVSSRMYVLDGLKDLMISMQWQAGDVVTFYETKPERKLVVGLRKATAVPSSQKSSERLRAKRTRNS